MLEEKKSKSELLDRKSLISTSTSEPRMKESIQVVVNQLLKPLTLTLQSTLKKSDVHEEKNK